MAFEISPVDMLNYGAWFVVVYLSVIWMLIYIVKGRAFSWRKALPPKLPSVSIVVPAHNEESSIRRTIESLLNLDYPSELREIIVVNDGSGDCTAKIAEPYARRGVVKLMTNSERRGKAYSLNRAVRASRGELVACMDGDSFVTPSALKSMVGYFQDKRVGAVAPALKVWRPRQLLEKAQAAEYYLNIFLRKILAFMDSVPVTPGPFSIYRRDALLKVGGFDEHNLTEDMEIALRLHGAGYRIENAQDAFVYTICPDGVGELYKQRVRWYTGLFQNAAKYRHMFFNRKYGNLGMFFLPMTILSIVFVVFVLFNIFYNVVADAGRGLYHAFLINFDVGVFFRMFSLPDIFSLNMMTLLSAATVTLGSYMLYESFRMSGERVRGNKLGYLSYLFAFPLLLTVFWFSALVHTIRGVKIKW